MKRAAIIAVAALAVAGCNDHHHDHDGDHGHGGEAPSTSFTRWSARHELFVEHPALVAQRIVRYARLVGRENVIAGTDCGFSTFAGPTKVHPTITWVKLGALVEGARLASRQLWS